MIHVAPGLRLRNVVDQGARGTCLAHAVTAAHESLAGKPSAMSAEYMFWAAKQRDGSPNEDGTLPAAVLDALMDEGQPEEAVWPYDPHRDSRGADYEPPAGEYALHQECGSSLDASVSTILPLVDQGVIPVMGIAVTEDLMLTEDGLLDASDAPLPVLGYHAMAIVGHGERDDEPVVVVRNSWGEDWGQHGFGLMPLSYIEPRLVCVLRLREEEAQED